MIIGYGSTNAKKQKFIEFNKKMIKIHPKNKRIDNTIFGNFLFADIALIEVFIYFKL
jgi:hypothetical protein